VRLPIFYGWVVVGAAFVSHFLAYGTQVVAFGLAQPRPPASAAPT